MTAPVQTQTLAAAHPTHCHHDDAPPCKIPCLSCSRQDHGWVAQWQSQRLPNLYHAGSSPAPAFLPAHHGRDAWERSATGRAMVSKTMCWRFKSFRSCHKKRIMRIKELSCRSCMGRDWTGVPFLLIKRWVVKV